MPRNFEEWLSLALWLAGAGHFCLLIASFQVPFRLGGKKIWQNLRRSIAS